MKWKLDISEKYKPIREIIDNAEEVDLELGLKILSKLEGCCDYLTPNDKQEEDYYDSFRDLKTEIHDEIEYLNEDSDIEDVINDELEEFYNLCDYYNIWLGI